MKLCASFLKNNMKYLILCSQLVANCVFFIDLIYRHKNKTLRCKGGEQK